MPISDRSWQWIICPPEFPGHLGQQLCFERQYKERGQFTTEKPKYAARKENQESQEPERTQGSKCQARTSEPGEMKPGPSGEGGEKECSPEMQSIS